MPNGCTSVGPFLRPAILVPPAGTKRVRCWGLEPGGPQSTSSSAEPLTDGHRVVSVATASGNLPRLVPILTAWPRLPPTLAQPVCRSSSSVMGGRLREAAGPSLAGGRGQHLSHSSVSLAGVLGGGCPWDPTVDSSHVTDVSRGKNAALGMLQRGEAGSKADSWHSQSGWAASFEETPVKAGCSGLALGTPPLPPFSSPKLCGFSLSASPSPLPEGSCLFGDSTEAGWGSVP